jgi:glycosyltransferase involved in cell wall biosynthesis
MKVSVAVVTYNHERYIARALDSVLMQQLDAPFEIIVSEDCSTDRTRDIIGQYQCRHPDRIRLLLSPHNLNTNEVLGRALAAARGSYIALLDGDDYWTSPHKLQRQADCLDRNPDCAICFHNVSVLYEDGTNDSHPFHEPASRHHISAPVPDPISTLEHLAGGNFMQTCSVMYRAGLVGDLPPWYDGCALGDWPLHVLHAQHGRIAYIDQILATYRVHSGGLWSSSLSRYRTVRDVESIIRVFELIDDHLGGRYWRLMRPKVAVLHERAARLALEARDRRRAAHHATKLLAALPLSAHRQQRRALRLLLRACTPRVYERLKSLVTVFSR